MATERLSMRQTREILRQKWSLGRTHREVAQSLRISTGAVGTTVLRARAAGLDWAQVDTLSDDVLHARVYGPPTPPTHHRAVPDCAYLHAERRRPGVTLELLHLEYLEQHPDGYRYTQFCEIYRRWLGRRGLSMRQVHHAGEKLFVDYADKKPTIVDATTGEVIEVELFVAVLGASNYTYAEATRTQQVPDWVASHQRAFQFFGGVTAAIVPDQLKSGVVVPCRYEPGVQRTYDEFALHYGTVILPARPAKPRDKAKIPHPRPRTRAGPGLLPVKGAPMLTAPTLEKLHALKLTAMAAAWTEQQHQADMTALAFDERFGLLVEAEWLARENKRLARALQEAKLKLSQACIEAIDYPARRELDKAVIRQLATGRWIEEHHNVILVGATGVGKSFLACALAHQACRKGYRAGYRRASRLFHELALARADGTYVRLLANLARLDVLVVDDWGLAPVQDPERRDFLEILEDRYGTHSTIITSQLPPAQWHDYLGEATLADAICDRLLHNAHRIVLQGPSRRKEAKLEG